MVVRLVNLETSHSSFMIIPDAVYLEFNNDESVAPQTPDSQSASVITDNNSALHAAMHGLQAGNSHFHLREGNVDNLGVLYNADQGWCLEDAERVYNHILAGKNSQGNEWGPEQTLDIVDNLGDFYAGKRHLESAERMYKYALAEKEKVWGPEHTSTLFTVNKLGILYADQGHYEDAERMYKHALTGYEEVLSPEHPSTLDTVNNLGILYDDQGHHEECTSVP